MGIRITGGSSSGSTFAKASSAEINIGTDDVKYITPAGIRGASVGLEVIGIACSDVTSALTTGEKIVFDIPFSFVVTRVYSSVATAPSGSTLTIDVKDEGTTILNSVLAILVSTNNAETSTFTGSTSSYTLTKGDLVSINIEQIGSTVAGAGLIVFLEGYRT